MSIANAVKTEISAVEADIAAAEREAVTRIETFIARVKAEGEKLDGEARHLLHLVAAAVTSHL